MSIPRYVSSYVQTQNKQANQLGLLNNFETIDWALTNLD